MEAGYRNPRPNNDWTGFNKNSSITLGVFVLLFTGVSVYSTIYMVISHRNDIRDHRIQEISLANFCFSNLNIVDDQVSGDWMVGLNLVNPAYKATVCTDIKYNVGLSAAPDVPIVNFHQGYPSVQPPRNRTVIYLYGSTEKLRLNHIIANSTTQDVINGKMVEFDLLIAVKCKNVNVLGAAQLELTCKGIKVLISPPKSAPMNSTGCATEILVCDLVKHRVKDDIFDVWSN